jgi:hypothetical protein
MDSLSRFEIMQESQANWLTEQLRAPVQASIFFHYNTDLFYRAGYRFGGRDGDVLIDEVILANDNVGLVSAGHTHPPENWHANFSGTYFHVVRASGYRRGTDYPGAAVITICTATQEYRFEDIAF